MFRRFVSLCLGALSALFLVFAAAAGPAWFERHVVVPTYRLPPPGWVLAVLRLCSAAIGVGLSLCARAAYKRATPGGVLRVAFALLLAAAASEIVLRVFDRPEGEKPNPRLEWILGIPDPRTGWAFVPNRSMVLPPRGMQRRARYSIDAHGDRAPSSDWLEDPDAPTVLITGESTAVGHGLEWPDTFAAKVAERMHVQVVN